MGSSDAHNSPAGIDDLQSHVLFDLAQLKELMGGDMSFVQELIELYLEEVPQRLERFLEHCERGNAKEARLEIHSVKGSSSTIGAHRLSELAWRIEKPLREGEPVSAIQDYITPLQDTYTATATHMQEALKGMA